MIYFLTAIGLMPGGSSTGHIYTQAIHRTTQLTTLVGTLSGFSSQSGQTTWEVCRPCHFFASYTLTFAVHTYSLHGAESYLRSHPVCS